MIRIQDIHKQFQDLVVLHDFHLSFEEGEITAILGPSGCGKSTLLNIVAGLIKADSGTITGTEQKTISYLFQEPRLLPWKNALENLEFVMPDDMDKREKKQVCVEMLKHVGLAGYEKLYPAQFSGGMSQRLAMARAFVMNADILFMDEPFQSLDLKRKEQMISLMKSLWLKNKPTVLMVTHDVQEALLLSDKTYILSDKPTKILQKIHNPMPFEQRTIRNGSFYSLEQQIINDYILS